MTSQSGDSNKNLDQARRLLSHAVTYEERLSAVQQAIRSGLPFHEIEQILDWLDHVLQEEKKNPPKNSPS